MKINKPLLVGMALTALPTLALAQDATTPSFDEIGPYIMTTLLFVWQVSLCFLWPQVLRC